MVRQKYKLTHPTASTLIRPPSLRQHLQEIAQRHEVWPMLIRNFVPVIGVYGLGWSAGLAVFTVWFDGLVALLATIAMLVPRALRETMPAPVGLFDRATRVAGEVFVWVFLAVILALPYWIVLIPLHPLMFAPDVVDELTHSSALWLTFGAIAAQNAWQAWRVGYEDLPERELKQQLRWNVYLLILRAIGMFMLAQFAFLLVPLLAVLLCYLEIWPERALGAVFGDPSRLHEHDPDKS